MPEQVTKPTALDLEAIEARAKEISAFEQNDNQWFWEAGEYDCGYPCTPNGCMGHSNGIPETLEGASVYIMAETGGVFSGETDIETWKHECDYMERALNDAPQLANDVIALLARVRELELSERARRIAESCSKICRKCLAHSYCSSVIDVRACNFVIHDYLISHPDELERLEQEARNAE